MDAFEFCKEFARMCNAYRYCDGCPLDKWERQTNLSCTGVRLSDEHIRERIDIVEKWSKEHQVKTMARDFFEKFPNAMRDKNMDTPMACPRVLGYTNETDCPSGMNCTDCWNRLMEE